MSARGEIFCGDLVRAIAGLRPADGRTAAAIAAVLGIHYSEDTQVPQARPPLPGTYPAPSADAASRHAPAAEKPDRTTPPAKVATDPLPSRPEGRDRELRNVAEREEDGRASDTVAPRTRTVSARRLADRPVDFSLTQSSRPTSETTQTVAPRSGRSPLLDDSGPVLALPHEPPWKRDWARGLTFAAVSTPVEGAELDQRSLVRKVARQEVLRAVPRRRRLSTRRGAQLLLDHGEGMAPYHGDRQWLEALVGSVAGRDRVEILRFRGSPLRGVVRGTSPRLERYRPPMPATPVVLVSDLGRTYPPFAGSGVACLDEWSSFTRTVRRTGCPAVCLTPYPGPDYPASLRREVAFIPFDRRISLSHAQEATHRIRRLLERG